LLEGIDGRLNGAVSPDSLVLFVFAGAVAIVVLVLAVPIAYRYLWPITIERPKLFLIITLTTGVVIAAVAIFWFLNFPVGLGITGASRTIDASHAAMEAVLRNRLLVASVFAVLVEYLICRIVQTLMDV